MDGHTDAIIVESLLFSAPLPSLASPPPSYPTNFKIAEQHGVSVYILLFIEFTLLFFLYYFYSL